MELPSQAGRVAMVTGSNTGIGRAMAVALARAGAHLVLANRSEEKTGPVREQIEAGGGTSEFLKLDLSDLAAVARAARQYLDGGRPLHLLINNAGLVRVREKTAQGFESTMGVNYLGHYLFTRLLLPALERGTPARVVSIASRAHERLLARRFDYGWFHAPTTYTGWPNYMRSKLCNVLFSAELARRVDPAKVRTYAVHPGGIRSDIWRVVPFPLSLFTVLLRTVEDGARGGLRCATAPELWGETGRYYGQVGEPRATSRLGADAALAKELWEKSDGWVRPWLSGAG